VTVAPGPPAIITCIDCGGRAHLVGDPPELGWQPGDLAVYRCEDCRDRWDLVVDEEDLEPGVDRGDGSAT
jgi:hypothetical protein